MFLLDDILLAPLKAVIWLGGKIQEVIEKEFLDEDSIKEKLTELQLQFELKNITEEEYLRQEKEILARLDAIRKEKKEAR
jgi:hypothetical protein